MWLLEVLFSGARKEYHLVGGCEYTLGRKDCDITIEGADASISRLHAKLIISSVSAPNLTDLQHVPEVHISDESKHGTFINGSRMVKEDARRAVVQGDVVILGRYVELKLQYVPIVVTPSELLSPQQYAEAKSAVCRIGGIFTEEPIEQAVLQREGVSPFMLLFCTNEVIGEPRALLAMMCRYVLVTPTYLSDIFQHFRDGAWLSLALLPSPGHFEAMRSPLLADAPYFRPEPAIFQPNEFLTHPLTEPRSTFRCVHFLFLEREYMNRYHAVAELGGATASYVPPHGILKWYEARSRAKSLNTNNVNQELENELSAFAFRGLVQTPHVHGLNVVVVVPGDLFALLMEHLTSTVHRRKSGIETNEVVEAYIALWKEGKSLVHEENIHIGVYTADAASQLQKTSPGVLCREEMEAQAPHSDDDSAATEDGIQPYVEQQRDQVERAPVVVHAAQQVIVTNSPRRERTPSVPNNTSTDLYDRWSTYQRDTSRSTTVAAAAMAQASPRRATFGSSSTASTASAPVARGSPLISSVAMKSPRSSAKRAQTTEEKTVLLCNSFLSQSLLTMAPKVEGVCSGALKAKYLTAGDRLFLKTSLQRIANFRATLDATLEPLAHKRDEVAVYAQGGFGGGGAAGSNLPPWFSKLQTFAVDSQRLIEDTISRSETVQSAVEATMKHLGATLPVLKPQLLETNDVEPSRSERQHPKTIEQKRALRPSPAGSTPSRRAMSPASRSPLRTRSPLRSGSRQTSSPARR